MKFLSLNELCNPKQWKTVASKDLLNEGYPVYGANGVIGFYSEYNHEKETILVTCRGATCGTVNICEPKSYVNGNAMALDNLEVEIIDINYLYYFLNYRGFNDVISGSAQPQIVGNAIGKILVPVLELGVQQKIAEVLILNEKLILKRKSQIIALDELTQSLFLETFGDPIKNPNDYELKSLSSICLKVTDGTHYSPPMVKEGYPYVSAKHLGKGYLDFFSKPAFISEEEHEKIYSRCAPVKGDVLYIKDGATTGIAAINHYDFKFSMLSSLALIKPNLSILNNYYLVHYLNNIRVKENILNNMSGGAIKRLTIKKINDLKIVVPPILNQKKFMERMIIVEEEKARLQTSLDEMNKLYSALLQKSFKGELF